MSPSGPVPGTTSVATVRAEVRAQILDGRLAPGQRLTTEALAEQLGVSRAPVREALRDLAGHGLVEIHDRRGARVVDLDAPPTAALVELLEVRRHLEPWAAAEAATHRGPADIERMDALVSRGTEAERRGDRATGSLAHHDLLVAIVEAADNPVLIDTCLPLIDRSTVVFRRLEPGELPDGWRSHRRVVTAIASGDRRQAATATRRHLDEVIAELRRR